MRVRWWVGMIVRFVCVIRVPVLVSVCPVCVPAPPGVFFIQYRECVVVRVRWWVGLVVRFEIRAPHVSVCPGSTRCLFT